ncbi:MAG: NAD(P)-dependent oxidoreductase [Actinomycetota bacterium]|nr:NAD(P)-dependent oxidoreductase [Actinomycetota bacterium]
MRILVTGSSGVIGRLTVPQLCAAGHDLRLPSQRELDLIEPDQVTAAVKEVEAIVHLAPHIPPPDHMDKPGPWHNNDRLRDNATHLLVNAALATNTTAIIVVPTVAFIYPPGPADESTPWRTYRTSCEQRCAEDHLQTAQGLTVAGRQASPCHPHRAGPLTTSQASRHATDRSAAPPSGLRRWAST